MPGASMRLTGTAAGDLRRLRMASPPSVSCESRGGLSSRQDCKLHRRSTAEEASQSGAGLLLFFKIRSTYCKERN